MQAIIKNNNKNNVKNYQKFKFFLCSWRKNI